MRLKTNIVQTDREREIMCAVELNGLLLCIKSGKKFFPPFFLDFDALNFLRLETDNSDRKPDSLILLIYYYIYVIVQSKG